MECCPRRSKLISTVTAFKQVHHIHRLHGYDLARGKMATHFTTPSRQPLLYSNSTRGALQQQAVGKRHCVRQRLEGFRCCTTSNMGQVHVKLIFVEQRQVAWFHMTRSIPFHDALHFLRTVLFSTMPAVSCTDSAHPVSHTVLHSIRVRLLTDLVKHVQFAHRAIGVLKVTQPKQFASTI